MIIALNQNWYKTCNLACPVPMLTCRSIRVMIKFWGCINCLRNNSSVFIFFILLKILNCFFSSSHSFCIYVTDCYWVSNFILFSNFLTSLLVLQVNYFFAEWRLLTEDSQSLGKFLENFSLCVYLFYFNVLSTHCSSIGCFIKLKYCQWLNNWRVNVTSQLTIVSTATK